MSNYRCYLILLFMIIAIYHNCSCSTKDLRIYTESTGYKCFWQGLAPFCFLRHGCPIGMTTMKIDKRGDSGYC